MDFRPVVVTGSLSYDHIMAMPGRFSDHILPDKIHMLNVSFIMQTFRREFGGTGGNIAYSLGLLGVPVRLVAAAGNDFEPYRAHFQRVSTVDISGVRAFATLSTAQGFAMTDRDDNQIWGFYQGAMGESSRLSVTKALKGAQFLIVGPNDVGAMIKYAREAQSKKVPYLFDPAFNIVHFTKKDLRQSLEGAAIIIGNDYEIHLIKDRLQLTDDWLRKGNKIVITTRGSKGSLIWHGKKQWKIPVAKIKNASDPTGAGDAYRAGFMAGIVKGYSLDVCGRMGAVAAAYTVEKYGTQTHTFTLKQFYQRYEASFGKIDLD